MNFHVWGPVSVRHNDLYSLGASNINDVIAQLQVGEEKQYVIYGDSAYPYDTHLRSRYNHENNTARQNLENRCMSSCRECIEWDYGNVGTMWKFIDYKKGLKMRQMRVARTYLVAMILRNAYNTLNGGLTSKYFACRPPSFSDWVSQGPRV
jgi:hypothetical protein